MSTPFEWLTYINMVLDDFYMFNDLYATARDALPVMKVTSSVVLNVICPADLVCNLNDVDADSANLVETLDKSVVIRSAEQCVAKKHLEHPPTFNITTSTVEPVAA